MSVKQKRHNLNELLQRDVPRVIALKRNDFQLYYSVISKLYHRLHMTMKKVDPYYSKYSSQTSYAGSHLDHLKITKPDEFDINFPVDFSANMLHESNSAHNDIVLEPQEAGFVKLRMRSRPAKIRDEWKNNQAPYNWADEEGYLLNSKFKDWFKMVVAKAFNTFGRVGNYPSFQKNGRTYVIRTTEAGPSLQLIVEHEATGFKMDVDLVPALKFPEDRWPLNSDYRPLPPVRKKTKQFWMVVPKPNKSDPHDEEALVRTWHLGLQNQEREVMFDKNFMKPNIRLMKKLRDTQGMSAITSYYIKTLFFWEIKNRNDSFWYGPILTIFRTMVQRLHDALKIGEINFYWNDDFNLIENVDRSILDGYCKKMKRLLEVLDEYDLESVAEFMFTEEEYENYIKKK